MKLKFRPLSITGLIFTASILAFLLTMPAQTAEKPETTAARVTENSNGEDHGEITRGEEIDIKKHMVEGKTVIFDFFSPFCPPCVRIKPYLKKLNENGGDVVVKFINLNRDGVQGIDWKSPVVKQYQVSSVPHFKIYDGSGNLVAEGEEAYGKVMEYIQEMEKKNSK